MPQNASKKVGAKPPTCLDALKASRGRPDAPKTDDFPNARNISNCRKKSRGAAKYHSKVEAVYCLVGAMSGYWAMSRGVGHRRLGVFGRPRAAGNPCQKTGCVAIRLKESFPGTRAAQIPKVYVSDPSKSRPHVGHRADVTAQSQRRKVVLQVFAGVGGSWRGGRRPRIRGSGWPAPGEGRRWGPAVRRPPQSGTSRRGPKSGYLQAALVEIFGPVFRRLSAELDPRDPSISVGRAPCIHVHELQQFFSHVVTNSDFRQAAFKHPKERSAGLIFDLRCS